MNLENLNLVELNAQEVKSIDGGKAPGIYNKHHCSSSGWEEFCDFVSGFLGL